MANSGVFSPSLDRNSILLNIPNLDRVPHSNGIEQFLDDATDQNILRTVAIQHTETTVMLLFENSYLIAVCQLDTLWTAERFPLHTVLSTRPR